MGDHPKEHAKQSRPILKTIPRTLFSAGAGLAVLLCVISATAAYGQKGVEDLERAIVFGTDEEKRAALHAVRVLASEEAARAAIPGLADRSAVIRATAAGSLSALPSGESIPALLPLLKDKEAFVRKEVAIALGRTGSPAAGQPLASFLSKEKKTDLRAAAVNALGATGSESSVGLLTYILTRKPSSSRQFERRSAARAIGRIALRVQGESDGLTTPESFLPSKFKLSIGNERTDLTTGSGVFSRAAQVLLRVIDDPKEAADTKREAAFALGEIGTADARPVLVRCSSAEDPYLSEACKESLAKTS